MEKVRKRINQVENMGFDRWEFLIVVCVMISLLES